MRHLLAATALILTLAAVTTACDDDTTTIGSSLMTDQVGIVIDSAFTITARPVPSAAVQSRTNLQLLGTIDAPGYGRFSSDFVTQFMPVEEMDTKGVALEDVYGCKLVMRMPKDAAIGDPLTPVGVTVYPLTSQLSVPIFSDFDTRGTYDVDNPLASTFYTLTDESPDEGGAKETLPNCAYVTMDLGVDFGRKLYGRYLENPSTFATPESFAKFFPGIYVTTTFGGGRVAQVDSTVITLFYHQHAVLDPDGPNRRDTIYDRSASYLAVTPEIISNNNMRYVIDPKLEARAAAGEPVIVAPVGYEVEIEIPADEIIKSYKAKSTGVAVINSLSLSLPVEEIANNYGLTPPPYVLMVKSSERENFFLKSRLPDNASSFYASYDSYNRRYIFSDMRQYILDLIDSGKEPTKEDMTFTLVPVTIAFEQQMNANNSYYYYYYYGTPQTSTTQIVSAVVPYVHRPAMGLIRPELARIVFTFATHSLGQ